MTTVTISKTKYDQLKRQADAYRRFAAEFFEVAVRDPIQEMTDDFRETGLYTKEFLEDLETGLRKSSYLHGYPKNFSKLVTGFLL